MNKIKSIVSFILALSAFVSCGRVTEENALWQLQSHPVVFSIISPTKTVQLSLSQTVQQNTKNDSIIYPGAKVFVCGEDKNWIELSRKSSKDALYSDVNNEIDVIEGKTYYLRVVLSDFTATSQTTIPSHNCIITNANFTIDSDSKNISSSFMGTLDTNIKLSENAQCILMAMSYYIDDKSTFLQREFITDRFSIPDSINSFDLKLISMDPYFAKYWISKNISIMQMHHEGDLSIFLGSYNGLLPPYSNIVNGVGLFGSYVTNSKTVNISQP